MNNAILQTQPVKILRGFGISTGIAVGLMAVAVGFFAYGRYLDSKLTKLKILEAERNLGIEHNGIFGDIKKAIN